jgi:SAM-dependent methyltransferase
MINKKYLKNLRCKEINNKNNFFFDLYSERILDSLDIITLDFKNILILGDNGTKINEYIQNRFKNSSITIYDFNNIISYDLIFKNIKKKSIDLDLWLPEKNEYDLIISNFFLNISENIDIVLNKILKSLVPNGFFLATIPSPENFYFLKSAMIKTDLQLYKGVYNRFNRTINIKNLVEILKKINFKIPLVDSDKINLEYHKFSNLLHDVRSMNTSYFYKDKKNTFEKKIYFKKLEENFSKNLKGNYQLSSNFYIISGWKEHSSQQKPMKPGEAKNKLKDYLG